MHKANNVQQVKKKNKVKVLKTNVGMCYPNIWRQHANEKQSLYLQGTTRV